MLRRATAWALVAIIVAILSWWWFAHGPLLAPPLVASAVLLLSLAFERWRYRQPDKAPPANFTRTDERFLDPVSQKSLRVYFNASTGERRYVDED